MKRKKRTTLKDEVSNYAGLVIALSGTVALLSDTVGLPDWTIKVCIVAGALAGAVTSWANGKGGDLKSKLDQYGRPRRRL